MFKEECADFREKIQYLMDALEPGDELVLTGEVKEHLSRCDDCREYFDSLVKYRRMLGYQLVESSKRVGKLNGSHIREAIAKGKERNLSLKKRRFLTSIAAILVLSVGIPIGLSVYRTIEEREIIAAWSSEVVDSVYSEPMLNGVEYSVLENTESFSDWLLELGENQDYF